MVGRDGANGAESGHCRPDQSIARKFVLGPRFEPSVKWVSSGRISHPKSMMASIKYDELLKALQDDSVVLVDVRGRDEVATSGKIIKSHIVPLPEFESAFGQMDEEQFESTYGFRKPKGDKRLVITCRSGRRAQTAAEALAKLGYDQVVVYSGSFLDWQSNDGPLE